MKSLGSRFIAFVGGLALVSLALITMTAHAEEMQAPLTLSEAIATALRQNPQLEAARFEVAATSAQTIQARSGLLPQLDISETYSNTDSPLWAFGTKLNQGAITAQDFDPERLNDPEAINNFKTALTLGWRIFDGGQTWIAWRQAQQNEEAGRLALRRSEQSTMARTATAYMGCLLADENRHVVLQSLDTARAHLKVVQDRERSGLAVKSDVLRAQVRISNLEQQHLTAESRLKVAHAMLRAAMGITENDESGAPLLLTTTLGEAVAVQGALNEWVAQALEQRPDLQQLQLQEEIARQGVSRARTGHYPSLALTGGYEINTEDFGDSKESYNVGAVLQFNLFSGQRISAQTAEAKAALSKIQSMRQGLALNVRVETQKAYYEAQSAWQSIQVAAGAVAQAEEGLRIVANRYENGLLALINLLDAQVALQQAQTQHFKAMHDFTVSRIALVLATGSIDKDFE